MKFQRGKETTEIHQSVRNIRQKSVACKVIQMLEVKTTTKILQLLDRFPTIIMKNSSECIIPIQATAKSLMALQLFNSKAPKQ